MRLKTLILSCFLLSCSSDNTILVKNVGKTQGTFYHIQYFSEDGKDYQNAIDSILCEIDSSLSIYKPYSIISQVNTRNAIVVDQLFIDVYKSAKKVYYETEGAFDCTVYPLLESWGFYKEDYASLEIDSTRFSDLLKYVGFDKVILQEDSLILSSGVKLDFNSIAQGYSVDLIGDFFDKNNISNYLIEIGGELLAKGNNANGETWRVGIDKPIEYNLQQGHNLQFILELEDKSIATSGNYRKYYEKDGVKYSHTINPSTGFPAQNRLLSVSVVHESCMMADAYATAFMVMGVKKTKQFSNQNKEIDICLVYTDKNGKWKTYISKNLEDQIIN